MFCVLGVDLQTLLDVYNFITCIVSFYRNDPDWSLTGFSDVVYIYTVSRAQCCLCLCVLLLGCSFGSSNIYLTNYTQCCLCLWVLLLGCPFEKNPETQATLGTRHRQTNTITQYRKLIKGSTKKQGVNQSACYGCSTVPPSYKTPTLFVIVDSNPVNVFSVIERKEFYRKDKIYFAVWKIDISYRSTSLGCWP